MIDPRAFKPLSLDGDAVRKLLPHRPPLLLVDGVEAISADPPALRAHKQVRVDEPIFAGHFPERPLWPGVYTVEGLAQTCAVLGALREEERSPGATAKLGAVLTTIDVKLTAPVLAGQRLDYLVVWTHTVDTLHRFDVEATVKGRPVARGTLTLATVKR